jgi:hypothetical protein
VRPWDWIASNTLPRVHVSPHISNSNPSKILRWTGKKPSAWEGFRTDAATFDGKPLFGGRMQLAPSMKVAKLFAQEPIDLEAGVRESWQLGVHAPLQQLEPSHVRFCLRAEASTSAPKTKKQKTANRKRQDGRVATVLTDDTIFTVEFKKPGFFDKHKFDLRDALAKDNRSAHEAVCELCEYLREQGLVIGAISDYLRTWFLHFRQNYTEVEISGCCRSVTKNPTLYVCLAYAVHLALDLWKTSRRHVPAILQDLGDLPDEKDDGTNNDEGEDGEGGNDGEQSNDGGQNNDGGQSNDGEGNDDNAGEGNDGDDGNNGEGNDGKGNDREGEGSHGEGNDGNYGEGNDGAKNNDTGSNGGRQRAPWKHNRAKKVYVLGKGRSGPVVRLFQSGHPVAFKSVSPSDVQLLSEIKSEISLYRQLKHLQGTILPRLTFAGFVSNGKRFGFSTTIEGIPLSHCNDSVLSSAVGSQAMLALRALHDNDVLHGDIKLSNFLLAPSGRVFIIDLAFGVRRSLTKEEKADEELQLDRLLEDAQGEQERPNTFSGAHCQVLFAEWTGM